MIAHAMRQKSFTSAPCGSVSIDGFPFATSPMRINIQKGGDKSPRRRSAIPMISQKANEQLRDSENLQSELRCSPPPDDTLARGRFRPRAKRIFGARPS